MAYLKVQVPKWVARLADYAALYLGDVPQTADHVALTGASFQYPQAFSFDRVVIKGDVPSEPIEVPLTHVPAGELVSVEFEEIEQNFPGELLDGEIGF